MAVAVIKASSLGIALIQRVLPGRKAWTNQGAFARFIKLKLRQRLIMRVADINVQQPYRSQTRICELPGCKLTTRESKPFCPDHVGENTHAGKVLAEIARREAEDEMVLKGEAHPSVYNLRGITARSILQQLAEHGTRTKERLCRELGLERKVLDGYSDALMAKGAVVIGRTSRGSETLSLAKTA
jgi:hypothetical protein